MQALQILDRGELERALRADLFLLFKHSPVCPISAGAFEEVRQFHAARPDVPAGWIDVIGQRAWSQWVAAQTGVTHQSPQALLIRGAAVNWHASHSAITVESLSDAVGKGAP